MSRDDFARIYESVCERRSWTHAADQVEVKLDGGRQQLVHLGFFEHEGAERLRLHTAIGTTRKIRPDRLAYALELNYGLPHGSFAVKDDLLVLVDTMLLSEVDVDELESCIAFLAETGDYYERSIFGPDSF